MAKAAMEEEAIIMAELPTRTPSKLANTNSEETSTDNKRRTHIPSSNSPAHTRNSSSRRSSRAIPTASKVVDTVHSSL